MPLKVEVSRLAYYKEESVQIQETLFFMIQANPKVRHFPFLFPMLRIISFASKNEFFSVFTEWPHLFI